MAITVTIRRSLPGEATTLTQIAHDAKYHWGYPESWIKHWESDLTITSDFIQDNQVYVAEEDGEICGFYALCGAELEHLCVTPERLGTGIGKALLIDAMDRAARVS
jgi:GNAT superfamily N-acetyltransferase